MPHGDAILNGKISHVKLYCVLWFSFFGATKDEGLQPHAGMKKAPEGNAMKKAP